MDNNVGNAERQAEWFITINITDQPLEGLDYLSGILKKAYESINEFKKNADDKIITNITINY